MRELSLRQRLTLLGASQRSCMAVQRRLDLADRARDAMLAANACDPYDGVAHDRYKACERVMYHHLKSLVGVVLASFVIEQVHESCEKPSYIIGWYAREVK